MYTAIRASILYQLMCTFVCMYVNTRDISCDNGETCK